MLTRTAPSTSNYEQDTVLYRASIPHSVLMGEEFQRILPM